MSKKHIICFGYREFAVDSITAATAAVGILSKLQAVRQNTDHGSPSKWHYEPDPDRDIEIKLKMNQNFHDPKSIKPAKNLSLPAPKRGTIRCICDKSDVSPKTNCAHCGRSFSESHSRTHNADFSKKLGLPDS